MPATEKTSLVLDTGVKNVIRISFVKIVFGVVKPLGRIKTIMKSENTAAL